jgi:hypothetical protein
VGQIISRALVLENSLDKYKERERDASATLRLSARCLADWRNNNLLANNDLVTCVVSTTIDSVGTTK